MDELGIYVLSPRSIGIHVLGSAKLVNELEHDLMQE